MDTLFCSPNCQQISNQVQVMGLVGVSGEARANITSGRECTPAVTDLDCGDRGPMELTERHTDRETVSLLHRQVG
jgi:hypothetical protein